MSTMGNNRGEINCNFILYSTKKEESCRILKHLLLNCDASFHFVFLGNYKCLGASFVILEGLKVLLLAFEQQLERLAFHIRGDAS